MDVWRWDEQRGKAELSLWLKRSNGNGSSPFQHTQNDKQKHRTKGGHKNASQQATSGEAGEAAEEQTADQGADDSDHQIADQAEATSLDKHASQPAGDDAYKQEPKNIHSDHRCNELR
jgi:hypothetical protein